MASNERVCQQNKIKVLCPLDPFSMYLCAFILYSLHAEISDKYFSFILKDSIKKDTLMHNIIILNFILFFLLFYFKIGTRGKHQNSALSFCLEMEFICWNILERKFLLLFYLNLLFHFKCWAHCLIQKWKFFSVKFIIKV